MDHHSSKTIDILSAGELLIDFISEDFVDRLEDANHFKKLQGGSPANMVMNMARLGNRALLAATVGKDDMGRFLHESVAKTGVDCSRIGQANVPTTLILVTRSKEVSRFEAYRGADAQILPNQFPDEVLQKVRMLHTTCFGLSMEPAQTTILEAAKKAVQYGGQLSIDANYAQKIWPDRAHAQKVVRDYCSMGALVKMSEVDWERLYETPLGDPGKAAAKILDMGASEVCLTLGGEGCFVATESESHRLRARAVDVKDTTGAGDAFWSGYLTAWMDGHSLLNRAKAGRSMAEKKLEHFGPLPLKVQRADIYQDFT
jgi:sugar/nucleoside kinase (ribokinase family)